MARLGAHNLLKLVFYQWHNLQRHLLLLGRVNFLKVLFFSFHSTKKTRRATLLILYAHLGISPARNQLLEMRKSTHVGHVKSIIGMGSACFI